MVKRYGQLAAVILVLGYTLTPCAAQVEPGDIIWGLHDNNGTMLVIDPITRDRHVLSQWPSVGAGPQITRISSVLVESSGDFLVSDSWGAGGLFRISHVTGDRSYVSVLDVIPTVGTGPIDSPMTLLQTTSGETILVNQGGNNEEGGFVTRVDLATGDRTLVSGLGVGSGPDFGSPQGAVLSSQGQLLVADYRLGAVIEVDMSSGNRRVLSGVGFGAGPPLPQLRDITILPDGDVFVSGINFVEDRSTQLLRIDPVTGDRELVMRAQQNMHDFGYVRLFTHPNGDILASNAGAVYALDPATSDRSLWSGAGLGSGPDIPLIWGDIAVAIPEPSTLVMAAGILGLAILGRLRRYCNMGVRRRN